MSTYLRIFIASAAGTYIAAKIAPTIHDALKVESESAMRLVSIGTVGGATVASYFVLSRIT